MFTLLEMLPPNNSQLLLKLSKCGAALKDFLSVTIIIYRRALIGRLLKQTHFELHLFALHHWLHFQV